MSRDGARKSWGFYYFFWWVREVLTNKVLFKQQLEGSEGTSHVSSNSDGRGPGVGVCLAHLRNPGGDPVGWTRVSKGKVVGGSEK